MRDVSKTYISLEKKYLSDIVLDSKFDVVFDSIQELFATVFDVNSAFKNKFQPLSLVPVIVQGSLWK